MVILLRLMETIGHLKVKESKVNVLGFFIFRILYLKFFDQNFEFSQNKNKIWH